MAVVINTNVDSIKIQGLLTKSTNGLSQATMWIRLKSKDF